MYEPDTILTLKEPKTKGTPPYGVEGESDYTEASDDYEPFAYDRVRVVGQSPINHAHISGAEWVGAQGQGVIIQPLNGFGSTLDEPYGKLQKLYDVESVPEPVEIVQTRVRVVNSSSGSAGPTPEEVFAVEAPGEQSKNGERVRAPRSPLDGLTEGEPESNSPLGD